MLQTHEKAEKMCARSQKKAIMRIRALGWLGSLLMYARSGQMFFFLEEKRSYDSAFYDSSRSSACVVFFLYFGIMTTFWWPLILARIHRSAFCASTLLSIPSRFIQSAVVCSFPTKKSDTWAMGAELLRRKEYARTS